MDTTTSPLRVTVSVTWTPDLDQADARHRITGTLSTGQRLGIATFHDAAVTAQRPLIQHLWLHGSVGTFRDENDQDVAVIPVDSLDLSLRVVSAACLRYHLGQTQKLPA